MNSERLYIAIYKCFNYLFIGGLIMGVGIETSSHKHGLFQHTCVSYDIILADGELVHCSKVSNQIIYFSFFIILILY